MGAKWLIPMLGFIVSPIPASAGWHVEERGHALVVIGAGQSPNGLTNFLSLQCSDGIVEITADTFINAMDDDIPTEYRPISARLSYGGIGERQEAVLEARASRSVGRTLTIVVQLDSEKSKKVMQSIAAGNRLGFEPVHPDISVEDNSFRIYNAGFTAVLFAVDKHCPELLEK